VNRDRTQPPTNKLNEPAPGGAGSIFNSKFIRIKNGG
jgi:hypothetical protein